MKRKIYVVFTGLLIVGVVMGSAVGQEMKKHIEIITDDTHGCGGSLCGLDLTEKQKEKFKDLDLKHDKALLPLKSDLKILDAELSKLLIADKPDKTAIDQKIDEIGVVKVKIEKVKVKDKLARRALLTDKQRVHFDKCGCTGGEVNIEKHMMFLGDEDGEKKIIIKKMGEDDDSMIWRDKKIDSKIGIKRMGKEEKEEE